MDFEFKDRVNWNSVSSHVMLKHTSLVVLVRGVVVPFFLILAIVGVLKVFFSPPGLVEMPHIFSNNMVLQRSPESAKVWGFSPQDEFVTVSLACNLFGMNQTHSVISVNGEWKVDLEPVEEPGPCQLVISGSKNTITFNNVMFGDVYLCSGQSNMQMTVEQTFTADESLQDSNNYPNLRIFSVQQSYSRLPLRDLDSATPYEVIISPHFHVWKTNFFFFSGACRALQPSKDISPRFVIILVAKFIVTTSQFPWV